MLTAETMHDLNDFFSLPIQQKGGDDHDARFDDAGDHYACEWVGGKCKTVGNWGISPTPPPATTTVPTTRTTVTGTTKTQTTTTKAPAVKCKESKDVDG